MHCYLLLLIKLTLLLIRANSNVYYVTPDDEHSVGKNIHSLKYYLMNTTKYFVSHSQLHFLSGQHYLQSDFRLQNVENITINGNKSIISCRNMSVGIIFINVSNITLQNIKLLHCGKDRKDMFFNASSNELEDIHSNWNGVIFINNCTVTISNVSINITDGMNGIIALSIYSITSKEWSSSMTNVHIYANFHHPSLSVNGIIFYYFEHENKTAVVPVPVQHKLLIISQYDYGNNGLCHNSFALKHIMMQNYSVEIQIQKTHFTYLLNSSILYYYGTACGGNTNTIITFHSCIISYNKGALHVNLFYIIIHSKGDLFGSIKGGNYCMKKPT